MPCRAGLRVDSLRLVATQRGGITLPDAATAQSKGGGLSGGTIAGIVVGVLFGLAALFCELPRIRNANRCVFCQIDLVCGMIGPWSAFVPALSTSPLPPTLRTESETECMRCMLLDHLTYIHVQG